MPKAEQTFLKKLLSTFKVEAEEHLKHISSGLLELEKNPPPEKEKELLEIVFRETHSFKGAARSVNQTQLESICQCLESIFAAIRRKEIVLSQGLFDILHRAANRLRQILSSVEASQASSQEAEIADLIEQLRRASQTNLPSAERSTPTIPPPQPESFSGFHAEVPDTIRINALKLQSMLLQAEELIPVQLALRQRLLELRDLHATLQQWKKEWAKIPISNLHSRQEETMERTHSLTKSLEAKLAEARKSLEQDHRALNRMTSNFLEETKNALLLPFSMLLELFPQAVRELSRDQGKEVDLVIEGSELEIDRRILQEMKDPLLHLVRNCIDHGIEKPEQRKRKNKPARGKILIQVTRRNGDKVEVLVADDGSGIDLAKVKAAAVHLGLLSSEEVEQLDQHGVLPLIFHSGLTTSPMLTNVSGRGLGLAILQEKVEKLGGIVSLETNSDAGTTFRIVLPLTLATFRGIVVRLNEELFVLPTVNVDRTMRISTDQIKTVENKETIQWNGRTLPFFRLADVLELPKNSNGKETNKIPVVVLGSAERRAAFQMDEVLHEQEVLFKHLGKQLVRVRNVAGATILGTGKAVTILNVSDLMKSASKITVPARRVSKEKKLEKKSILVVEDSITARTLLKNILESAGYSVTTAIDGMEGFTTLKEGDFALVVTDVDMPRMNGFDLTTKIRSDKKLSELPVILVTALESREDREKGIDVGANAYIVKRSFDQSNLLEAIRRLV